MTKTLYLGMFIIALLIVTITPASAGFFDWWNKVTGRATSDTETLNVTVGNTAPVISFVTNISTQSVTENGNTTIRLNMTVVDPDGNGLINTSTAVMSLNRSGQATRSNETCLITGNSTATSVNLTCIVSLKFFDGAGGWTINATIKDNSSSVAQNLTQNFSLSETTCIVLAPKSLTWASIGLTDINALSTNDPVVVNNTCNDNIDSGNVRVTAISLLGESTPSLSIRAANFTVNIADACDTGTAMVNGTVTGVTSSILAAANHSPNNGTTGQEQLYFCLEAVDSDLTQQSYSTASAQSWTISVV